MIVAIDGPAGSGKSTTAKLVGSKMNFLYIDTGAMYRAMALRAHEAGIDFEDKALIKTLLPETEIEQTIDASTGNTKTFLNGKDVSAEIRTPVISRGVTAVCEIDEVRTKLVELQRAMASKGDVILDGRDIGTVVFPDADLKFFMVADISIRAQRRFEELKAKGIAASFNEIKSDIERRDHRDSSRSNSPLKPAPDSILIDTSALSIEEQAELIISHIKKKL
jgi:CMP/dCMP kinase